MYQSQNRLQAHEPLEQEPMNDELRFYLERMKKTEQLKEALGTIGLWDIHDLAITQPGSELPDCMSESYRFVALEMVPASINGRPTSVCEIPDGIESNYKTAGGTPFLDGTYAIGLVYNDILGAVGAAKINFRATGFMITQLQGVNTGDPHTKSRYQGSVRGGLMNGLAWRDTLVRSWEYASRQIEGLTQIEIQGAANNDWKLMPSSEKPANQDTKAANKKRQRRVPPERLVKHYDNVAERMSYVYDPETRNWRKPLFDSPSDR
ncbi:MAG TPA: hypothetical protein VF733_01990 [Candidatus Saccharimonadales bacterium]